MKPVTVGEKKYRIVFRYPKKRSHKRNAVECNIVATYPMEGTTVQEVVGHGRSVCNLKEDEFLKEKGRRTSLARAAMELPRIVRTALWKSYWDRYLEQ